MFTMSTLMPGLRTMPMPVIVFMVAMHGALRLGSPAMFAHVFGAILVF